MFAGNSFCGRIFLKRKLKAVIAVFARNERAPSNLRHGKSLTKYSVQFSSPNHWRIHHCGSLMPSTHQIYNIHAIIELLGAQRRGRCSWSSTWMSSVGLFHRPIVRPHTAPPCCRGACALRKGRLVYWCTYFLGRDLRQHDNKSCFLHGGRNSSILGCGGCDVAEVRRCIGVDLSKRASWSTPVR